MRDDGSEHLMSLRAMINGSNFPAHTDSFCCGIIVLVALVIFSAKFINGQKNEIKKVPKNKSRVKVPLS